MKGQGWNSGAFQESRQRKWSPQEVKGNITENNKTRCRKAESKQVRRKREKARQSGECHGPEDPGIQHIS